MTVKELIEKLQSLDAMELPVEVMVAATIDDPKVDSRVDYLFSDTNLSIRMAEVNEKGVVTIYGDLERSLEA